MVTAGGARRGIVTGGLALAVCAVWVVLTVVLAAVGA